MTGSTLPAAVAATGAQAGGSTMSTPRAALVAALIAVGTFFLTVGSIGLLRLPDVYNRLHATSKATTLGAASTFLAGAVYFGPGGNGLTALVGIVFLFLTAPTGAHMISRSAHRMGVAFFGDATWPGDRDASDRGAEAAADGAGSPGSGEDADDATDDADDPGEAG